MNVSCGCNKLGMFCTKCNGESCNNTTPVSLDNDKDEDVAPILFNIEVNDEDENESQTYCSSVLHT